MGLWKAFIRKIYRDIGLLTWQDHVQQNEWQRTPALPQQAATLHASPQAVYCEACSVRLDPSDKFCSQCGMPCGVPQRERTTGPMRPVSPALTDTGLHKALTKEDIQRLKTGQFVRAVNHQVFQQQQRGE